MQTSRRAFIARIAQVGGYAAAFTAMQALGFLADGAQASELPALPAGFGTGKKVVILGAGIAGLVSAYELGKAGFSCTILEARSRPGGRAWSIRNGSKVEFTDGAVQTCTWGEDQWMNPGPARIPSIHVNYLGYAHELGVPLEVEVNTSRSALMQAPTINGGKAVQQRQVDYDTRGYIAELLAKSVNQHGLDERLTGGDVTRMLDFLRKFGDLDDRYAYVGSARSGYDRAPGAGMDDGQVRKPLPLHDLLVSDFSTGEFYEEQIDWQATMFQPVGGMDRLPFAFARKLGAVIQYETPVQEIRKTPGGVKIVYAQAGRPMTIEADYCICTLPLPILAKLKTDFDPAHVKAFSGMPMTTSYKVGWESPRFWEKEDHIYGGISFLKREDVNLVWYPSYKMFSPKGVIIGGFGSETDGLFTQKPTAFGALSTEGKLAASKAAIETLHPGRSAELTKPIYVSWQKIPYSLGCAANTHIAEAQPAYRTLIEPDGRLMLAGDYCSHIGAWQEGAILSAHRAIKQLSMQVTNRAA